MLLGGTLQSGTVVANADDNVQSDSNTIMAKTNFDDIMNEILQNRGKLFDYVWKPDLEDYKSKLLYEILTQDKDYKDKIEVMACGNNNSVDRVISILSRLIESSGFRFNIEEYWYTSLLELKTGKHVNIKGKIGSNQPVERVVNRPTVEQSAGLPSIKELQKGKFYKLRIKSHQCYLLIYVKK